MLKDKIIGWLLNEFNLSQADIDKVAAILDKVQVKTVGDQTVIEIRLNKVSVILEGDKSVY